MPALSISEPTRLASKKELIFVEMKRHFKGNVKQSSRHASPIRNNHSICSLHLISPNQISSNETDTYVSQTTLTAARAANQWRGHHPRRVTSASLIVRSPPRRAARRLKPLHVRNT
ncbi:hypothetical protein PUN28_011064 [Cardiocondyla obscurior]|uniref:Uncharacterized protein n=1 Tax=Cardiocondyla obscurior TaxID=286306 RepID=A0AAW2FL78_9HYME